WPRDWSSDVCSSDLAARLAFLADEESLAKCQAAQRYAVKGCAVGKDRLGGTCHRRIILRRNSGWCNARQPKNRRQYESKSRHFRSEERRVGKEGRYR